MLNLRKIKDILRIYHTEIDILMNLQGLVEIDTDSLQVLANEMLSDLSTLNTLIADGLEEAVDDGILDEVDEVLDIEPISVEIFYEDEEIGEEHY